MELGYSILFLFLALGMQMLMRRFQVPRVVIRLVTYLIASVYIANPPITDRPYHLMNGGQLRYSSPDTLAYNMLLLLTIMAFVVSLLLIAEIISYLVSDNDAFRPQQYIMYGTKRFFSRLGDILGGSFLALVSGYGLLLLFHYASVTEIMVSLKELWWIAHQSFFFLPCVLSMYLFVMCACYIFALIIRFFIKIGSIVFSVH